VTDAPGALREFSRAVRRRERRDSQSRRLAVIEDAAQSIGSRYEDRNSGSFGTFAAFSAHPLKNLNAAGDGGFLATNDQALAEKVKLYRSHGLVDRNTAVVWGTVSRMDVLQAWLLSMRLRRLPEIIERRR